jgi:hypothetical protein
MSAQAEDGKEAPTKAAAHQNRMQRPCFRPSGLGGAAAPALSFSQVNKTNPAKKYGTVQDRRGMEPSSIPLVVAAIAFLALVLWRVRPLGWSRRRRAQREELVRARLRIESATDDHTRALALCDAADITAVTIAGTESAAALY